MERLPRVSFVLIDVSDRAVVSKISFKELAVTGSSITRWPIAGH